MVEAARARGYQYVAVTDHTKHATVARGLDEKRLAKHLDEIGKLSEDFDDIRILKSSEVDILADGKPRSHRQSAEALDVVVAAVHYKFELDAQKQTDRILRAMDNKYVQHSRSPDRAAARRASGIRARHRA
jgi:DNA polymerase (family 10)